MLPVIAAKYTARARGTSWGRSSKNNEQIAIAFEVTEGEHAGSVITYIGVFTDNTTEYVLEALANCGWPGGDLIDLFNLDEEACARLLPDAVQIVCQPDTYMDKTTLKVRFVNKVGAGAFAFKDAMSVDEARAFSARMKALTPKKAAPPSNGAKSPF